MAADIAIRTDTFIYTDEDGKTVFPSTMTKLEQRLMSWIRDSGNSGSRFFLTAL